jgi:hypothetical protein
MSTHLQFIWLWQFKAAFEKTEPSSPQTVAWEIQNIERLKEKLESRERLRELIRQQRDTIYINIATNASMRERYRLYSKWGIRRMSRARLRKVIYELLWKDPKRFVYPPFISKRRCLSSAAVGASCNDILAVPRYHSLLCVAMSLLSNTSAY